MWLDEVGPAMIGAMSKHCLVRKRMTAAEAQSIACNLETSPQTVSVLFPDVAPVVTSLNVVRVLSVSPPARAAEDLAGCG